MNNSGTTKERRLFIANRGEIAVRIQRTAALFPRAGYPTQFSPIAIHTPQESTTQHVTSIPRSHQIPLQQSGPKAYLDPVHLADLAHAHQAWGVIPGYGFLSESPEFAQEVEKREMAWIGPTSDQLRQLGDKALAKELARKCGVPSLESTHPGQPASLQDVIRFAERYTTKKAAKIIIKAINGGGGRGMRVVTVHGATNLAADVEVAYNQCSREAKLAFNDDRLYAELYLEKAKHIEVQVLGDGSGDVAHFWERECSLQRKHQKLVEIAPSPSLDPTDRKNMIESALKMAASVSYRSLGTFEFLFVPHTRDFYFMEINPRIQVEHTVTEEITGVDLVALQLQVALGHRLQDLGLGKHHHPIPFPTKCSIQIRLNAEKFLSDGSVAPTAGKLTALTLPSGPGVRVDTAAHPPHGGVCFEQTPLFDSLLAKVIFTAPSYELVVRLARTQLSNIKIGGLQTNLDLQRAIIDHADFLNNINIHTNWFAEHLVELQDRVASFAVDHDGAQSSQDSIKEDGKSADAPPEGVPCIQSPIAGQLVNVFAEPGNEIREGQEVALIESMKMEHVIRAPMSGKVVSILAQRGSPVNENDAIIHIEPLDGRDGESAAEKTTEDEEDATSLRPDLAALLERKKMLTDDFREDALRKRKAAGFLSARQNLGLLVDPGTFIEYGDLMIAAQRSRTDEDQLKQRTSTDGVLTGWATVNRALFDEHDIQTPSNARCALCIYDYSVLAGTQGHFHHLKLDRLFRTILENPAPLILYAEGGGGRPGDVDLANLKVAGLDTPSFALLAAIRCRGYPSVGLANGYTFAGNAALLGTCDIVVATEGGAKNAPRPVATSTGMGGPAMIEGGGLGRCAPQDVGPVDIHVANGDYDVIVPTETEAAQTIKQIVSFFQGALKTRHWKYSKDVTTMRRLLPQQRTRAYDVHNVIDALADDGSFIELGKGWGHSFITGLARVAGQPVGILASSVLSPRGGAIDAQSARKATRLLQMLHRTQAAHLVVLCDTPGFMVGTHAEKEGGLRDFADLFSSITAFQEGHRGGRVFAITLRKAYGLGAEAVLGGSTMSNFFSVSWPQGEYAAMGIEGSVRLGMRKELDAVPEGPEREELFQSLVDIMYQRGKAQNVATMAEIDSVIDPMDTRQWIINGLRHTRQRVPTWRAQTLAHSSHL